MRVSIIGYKNHALRLKKSISSLGFSNIVTFNHHVDDFNDILDSNAFFIASPNATHMDWINKLSLVDAYIFCEKPPVTNLVDLKKIKDYREKFFFNFNYRFSYLSKLIKSFLSTQELGKVININCVSTHGLAHKKKYKKNWRFDGQDFFSSIVGNVGIHYIDLLTYLFGNVKKIDLNISSVVSKKSPDSCSINLNYENILANIFLSYSTVFRNKIDVFFEDGIISLNNGLITIQSPRDTFDKNGFFTSPKKKK